MLYSCIKRLYLPFSGNDPTPCNAACRHASAMCCLFNEPHRPRRGRARRRRWVASSRRRWEQPCGRPCQLTSGAVSLRLPPPSAYCSSQRVEQRWPPCARSAAPCRVQGPWSPLCFLLASPPRCSSAAAVNGLAASPRVCGGLQSEFGYLIGSDQNTALNRLQKCGQNVANSQIANQASI